MKKSGIGLIGGIGIGLLVTIGVAMAAVGGGSPVPLQTAVAVVDSVPQIEATTSLPDVATTTVATTSVPAVSVTPAKVTSPVKETAPAKVVAPQPTAPKVAPANECNPNYSGCLKVNAGDYDCAGGSGNGPNYTGPVQVIGSDVFGLDKDHDGMACE